MSSEESFFIPPFRVELIVLGEQEKQDDKQYGKIKIIADRSVDQNFGTGALGVTPAHSIADFELAQKNNLPIFGPTKNAARLESSKVYSSQFMHKQHIPQPEFTVCSTVVDAYTALEKVDWEQGIVIKADGLASGKGVFIPKDLTEAIDIVRLIMVERIFGSAGDKILLQEKF